ncbi:hypothetical protein [Streptomyces antarcticus]|nr:hypothetical protein [Streptomyces sp. H34-AA3]
MGRREPSHDVTMVTVPDAGHRHLVMVGHPAAIAALVARAAYG